MLFLIFSPNVFVTGIILDYLSLVSENPSPLPFLEKKNFWEVIYTPKKPLYYKSFYNKSFTFTSCS